MASWNGLSKNQDAFSSMELAKALLAKVSPYTAVGITFEKASEATIPKAIMIALLMIFLYSIELLLRQLSISIKKEKAIPVG